MQYWVLNSFQFTNLHTKEKPSGTLKPSSADKQLTKKLQRAAEVFDIQILDHLIITQKAYFSFADNTIL